LQKVIAKPTEFWQLELAPRSARLDAPGRLDQVVGRGREREKMFPKKTTDWVLPVGR